MDLLHFTQAHTHSHVNFTLAEYPTMCTQAVCFSVLVSVHVSVLGRVDAFEASCRPQCMGSNLLFLSPFSIARIISGLQIMLK